MTAVSAAKREDKKMGPDERRE